MSMRLEHEPRSLNEVVKPEEYEGLAVRLAEEAHRKADGADLQDCITHARAGLAEAVSSFSPSEGTTFAVHAELVIRTHLSRATGGESRMLNRDPQLRHEVNEMFNGLKDYTDRKGVQRSERSVESGGDPAALTYQVPWQFDGKSNQPRADWKDEERIFRDNLKQHKGRPNGGRRPGAGRPTRAHLSRKRKGKGLLAGQHSNNGHNAPGQPEDGLNVRHSVDQ
jgi:hypothetical protein